MLAKLLAYGGSRPSMAEVGAHLSISASEVHAALKRLERARLLATDPSGTRPLLQAVEEFLVHGVKYAFPAKRGEVTRGVYHLVRRSAAQRQAGGRRLAPRVAPSGRGGRGVALEPLYPSAPAAALRNPALYELLR